MAVQRKEREKKHSLNFAFVSTLFSLAFQMKLCTTRTICFAKSIYKHLFDVHAQRMRMKYQKLNRVIAVAGIIAPCALSLKKKYSFTRNYESVTRSECLKKEKRFLCLFICCFFFLLSYMRRTAPVCSMDHGIIDEGNE